MVGLAQARVLFVYWLASRRYHLATPGFLGSERERSLRGGLRGRLVLLKEAGWEPLRLVVGASEEEFEVSVARERMILSVSLLLQTATVAAAC